MITEIIVVFSDEEHAQRGLRALKELQAEDILALYGSGVLLKDTAGQLGLQSPDGGPFGMSVGAMAGGSLGLLAGPLGVAIGATAGAAAGGWHEMQEDEYRSGAVAHVASQLPPGGSAVVAEVAEFGDARLEERMRAIGGLVLHGGRLEVEYQDTLSEVLALCATVDEARFAEARTQSADTAGRLSLVRAFMQQQTDGRLGQLRQQAERSEPDARADLERQIAQICSDHQLRLARLEEAWTRTQSALEPEVSARA